MRWLRVRWGSVQISRLMREVPLLVTIFSVLPGAESSSLCCHHTHQIKYCG